jgi:MATE family, multidrug efflux pump
MLLHKPIVSLLFVMPSPNVLVMFAQATTGLVETWFVAIARTLRLIRLPRDC